MQRLIFAALALLSADAACARDYTEAEMEFAMKLGAAMALMDVCPTDKVETEGIRRAIAEAGLEMSDVLGETALRAQVKEQSSTVMAMMLLRERDKNWTRLQTQGDACESLIEYYGPEGTSLPGLAPAL